jgi:transcriptional regulator with XRE-family HTH domain
MVSEESGLGKSTLTSEQIRAARMLLRWLQKDLAENSGISLPVVKRVETEPGEIRALPSTIEAFQRAFENEGIMFLGGQFLGAVLRQNLGETDTRLQSPALKRARAVKMVFRSSQPRGLR